MVLGRIGWLAIAAVVASGCGGCATAPVPPPARSVPPRAAVQKVPTPTRLSAEFSIPAKLRPAVDFWKNVFATWSRRQVALHDTVDLSRVYSVLDFRPLASRGLSDVEIERAMSAEVEQEKERIRAILIRLHQAGGKATTDEELRIAALFKGKRAASEMLEAAADDRIRSQTGLRERFSRGIEVAHRYFPELERTFRAEGVPIEITRLPLIESCFNVQAYSKVGAAGVWQFMPATGRRFMRIDDLVDERRDPIIAGRAAAKFMRENFKKLGEWPLAITAYNHGPAGMARAVRETGTTDIVKIIERYKGPAFKFASRNFFPEFLAALEIEQDHQRYYGPLNLDTPLETDLVSVPHPLGIESASRCAGTDADVISALNPSLARSIQEGRQRIPANYSFRIPAGSRSAFETRYASLPAEKKQPVQTASYVVHRVSKGQSLNGIARRYGRSVAEIRRYNNLRSKQSIRTGQMIRIPTS